MLSIGRFFADQVSLSSYLNDLFYIFSTVGVLLGSLALVVIESSLVDTKNVVDTIIQKTICGIVGAASFLVVGYGIWNIQYYQAFGVPHAFTQSISDWWLFGPNLNTYAQHLDPAAVPGADTQQIFMTFFLAFAALTAIMIQGAGVERMKSSAAYAMSAVVGGLGVPIVSYFVYGSASILTNNGLHDYVGLFSLYLFAGTWSVVLAAMLGKRVYAKPSLNFPLLMIGVTLLLAAIPMFVVGCGFLESTHGYFGISMNESGLGITVVNIFVAFCGGGLSGAWLAHRQRKPALALLGIIAGYVACTALFDLASPWQTFVVSLIGPFAMVFVGTLLSKLGVDDPKVAPLTLGPGIVGALAAGIVGGGRPTGGFFEIKTGEYAFQHSHISLQMQGIGVVSVVLGTAIAAVVVLFIIDKTIGLRVSSNKERDGLDMHHWTDGNARDLAERSAMERPAN
ncbi:hypothetical protein [Paraburkholderia caribensis]|uniref:hypothetical protein n=1 Tax=Paraburkholderia caribensis TaxID=75105 RepID=UPI001CAF36E5|nr:hypothetical protein [Paraburkholderia caribensis]CAG9262311.1 Ammonium_transp domain-containing protein [Paraburkholderia caribensis]